jgi:hypothetical protein
MRLAADGNLMALLALVHLCCSLMFHATMHRMMTAIGRHLMW